jgi:hypothetical protein
MGAIYTDEHAWDRSIWRLACRATLLQRAGEFPAPLEHEFRISDDATRYYKSGKSFLYRMLPFWLASLADRAFVLLVPVIVLLLPGLRRVPTLYQWRVKARIYRWYGALIGLEREALRNSAPEPRKEMLKRLDDIENGVNNMKMPPVLCAARTHQVCPRPPCDYRLWVLTI